MSLPPFGPVPVRTSLRTRSGCFTTSAWATKPPREKEKMSILLKPRVAVAVAAGFGHGINLNTHDFQLDGAQQLMTSAGMGGVALGAGAALFQRRATRPASATAASE